MNIWEAMIKLAMELEATTNPEEASEVIMENFLSYGAQFEPCPTCKHPHLDYIRERFCDTCACHLTGRPLLDTRGMN